MPEAVRRLFCCHTGAAPFCCMPRPEKPFAAISDPFGAGGAPGRFRTGTLKQKSAKRRRPP